MMANTRVKLKEAPAGSWQTAGGVDGTPGRTALLKLFTHALKDIYQGEKHLVKTLPQLMAAATTDELKEAFNEHLQQTIQQVARLEKVFALIGQQPVSKKCEAMEGLTREAAAVVKETVEGSVTRDAGLILAAQKTEHYEIATYGTLVQLAITLGEAKAAELLTATLEEEKEADILLTQIAENHINQAALYESG